VEDLLPEAIPRGVGVQVGEDVLGPRARGTRDDGPVRRALVDDLAALAHGGQLVLAEPAGIQVGHEAGMRRPRQPDARGAQLPELEDRAPVPVGHVRQGVLRGVQDPLALDVQVEVAHVDELGPRAVGGARDRASQGLLADLRADRHDLAGLDVRRERHGQLREPVEHGRIVELTHAGGP
jgi:hypothetical protein